MGDLEPYQPAAGLSSDDGPSPAPWIIGALAVAMLVAIAILASRHNADSGLTGPNPYIDKVEVSGLHMSTAENFAGGRVTYIEGRLTNHGDKKITAVRIEVLFKDSLGQVAQKDALPVMVLQPNLPYLDYGPLTVAPLFPGRACDFRLTIEHITAEWDGQLPQTKVVGVSAGS
jgi:hypothetical protein